MEVGVTVTPSWCISSMHAEVLNTAHPLKLKYLLYVKVTHINNENASVSCAPEIITPRLTLTNFMKTLRCVLKALVTFNNQGKID
jgi:hypothetical protein